MYKFLICLFILCIHNDFVILRADNIAILRNNLIGGRSEIFSERDHLNLFRHGIIRIMIMKIDRLRS